MSRDSVLGTFLVAAALCLACSLLVSAAAVGLRPIQNENKADFQRRNILKAAGMYDEDKPLDQQFENIESLIIDLGEAEAVGEGVVDPETYDPKSAAKDPERSVAIPPEKDLAGIKRREKYARVYLVKDSNGNLEKVILPVYGKGLWSTLYGFLAIEADLNTVAGLTFYDHKETPGLGGEIENEDWLAKWPNKKLYDPDGKLVIEVVKGEVMEGAANENSKIDGLSGATITSRGVSNLLRYWLSDHAFGPYLDKLEAKTGADNG